MSLGSDLSAARAEAGMTLAQVAEQTRIRSTVIAGIEADDFSLCGGDVYARGHIRSIAKVVGANPEPLVAEFDRLHVPQGPSAVAVFEADSRVATLDRRRPNWTAAMASVVVLLLVVAGFQLLRGGHGAPTAGAGPSGAGLPSQSAPSSSSTASTTTTSTSTPGASPSSTVVAQVPPSA